MNAEVVQRLSWIAEDLDDRGYPYVGGIRAAARLLAMTPEPVPDGCQGCGGPLPEGHRKWCDESCRRRHRD